MAYKYTERITVGTAPDGRRIRKRIYGNTKTELEANRLRVLKEADDVRNPSDITFGKYSEKWLSGKAVRSYRTQEMYRNALKKAKPINGIKLREVTRADLQCIVNEYWQYPNLCGKIVMTLRAVFKTAQIDGIINYNPALALEKPRNPKKPRRVLKKDEVAKILAAPLEPMERMYIEVLYCFGLRPGEAHALMPADFDLDRRILTVSKSVTYIGNDPEIKGTKTDNVRRLPVPAGMVPELTEYFRQLPGLYLFCMKNGGPMTRSASVCLWNRIMDKVNTALGGTDSLNAADGIVQYTFRRTFATDLYYSGVTIKKAAQLMGHSDTKMIMEIYAQLDDEREDLAALTERFDAVVPEASGPEVDTKLLKVVES